jgi:hypothetical protein
MPMLGMLGNREGSVPRQRRGATNTNNPPVCASSQDAGPIASPTTAPTPGVPKSSARLSSEPERVEATEDQETSLLSPPRRPSVVVRASRREDTGVHSRLGRFQRNSSTQKRKQKPTKTEAEKVEFERAPGATAQIVGRAGSPVHRRAVATRVRLSFLRYGSGTTSPHVIVLLTLGSRPSSAFDDDSLDPSDL